MSSETGYSTVDNSLDPSHPINMTNGSSGSLRTFAEMWYQVFLCALLSSIVVHAVAATIAFATLRKHKFGKFFPIFILVMGLFVPVTSGAVSSAAIAFVYESSSLQMAPWYPLVWGVGHTLLAACIGFTRILATL